MRDASPRLSAAQTCRTGCEAEGSFSGLGSLILTKVRTQIEHAALTGTKHKLSLRSSFVEMPHPGQLLSAAKREAAATIREALVNSLQKAFEEQVSKVPQAALRLLLERKLKDAGANLPPEGIDAMAQHLLAGEGDSFSWDDGSDDEIDLGTLSFGDEDFVELQRMVSDVTDGLPEMVQSVTRKSAADLFKTLKTNWKVEGAVRKYETEEFKERLEERWGEALDLLRMLLTCCRELGEETFKRYRRSKSKRHQHRRFVLARLHVRACQVADEIITLMENGFADGAMARWRTLYEIGVIVTLIETGDEDLEHFPISLHHTLRRRSSLRIRWV